MSTSTLTSVAPGDVHAHLARRFGPSVRVVEADDPEGVTTRFRAYFAGDLADFAGQPISIVATPEPDHPLRRLPNVVLTPHIDARTMEIHHTKHHNAYVTNLNKALESAPELSGQSLEQLLATGVSGVPETIRTAVRNNGGGHANHTLFWEIMGPDGGKPEGDLLAAIDRDLGGMEKFVKKGATVVVKPNIGWDRTPEQAANTDPAVVAALVEMSYKAGAKRVIVSAPSEGADFTVVGIGDMSGDVFGNGKTAIRGGFGMFKDRMQGNPTRLKIAASVNTNPVVIRRILGSLRQAQIVTSQIGSCGGWYLHRKPEKASCVTSCDPNQPLDLKNT